MLLAGTFYQKSVEFINQLSTVGTLSGRKLFRRKLHCLRPFGIQLGLLTAIRKIHLLVFYMFSTNIAITLLQLVPNIEGDIL